MQSIGASAGRVFAWWTGELSDCVPGRHRRQVPKADVTVHLLLDGQLQIVTGSKWQRRVRKGGETAVEALMRVARSRRNAKVRLRVPQAACLQRTVEIPRAARRQAGSILALELERSTPFRAAEVLTAFTLEPSQRPGWLTATQTLLKKKSIEPALREIEALGLKVVHADCWNEEGKESPVLDFLDGQEDHSVPASGRFVKFLTLACLALAMSYIWLDFGKLQAALDGLEARLAAERQKMAEAQKGTLAAEAAQTQAKAIAAFVQARRPSVEIIDELTRLLADDITLESLKLDRDALEITGLAQSASSVVPTLERAPAFKDAEPLSPITFDGTAGKEHFSYRVKLRETQTSSAAATPPPGDLEEAAVP